MKIEKITWQLRNDFCAQMVCEHCNSTQSLDSGYNDNYYHHKVLPSIFCKICWKRRDGERLFSGITHYILRNGHGETFVACGIGIHVETSREINIPTFSDDVRNINCPDCLSKRPIDL